MDRYAYVNNVPVNLTDPSGHMVSDGLIGEGGGCEEKCLSNLNKTDNKKKNNDDTFCKTVICNAFKGNIRAILDTIIPTHLGWREQFEGGVAIGNFSPSGTLGINVVLNRKSGELAAFADYSYSLGGGVGLPVAASITNGPIVGWGSSSVKDVARGTSAVLSATVAPDLAISGSASIPINVDSKNLLNTRPHVDSTYGIVPMTVYGGIIGGGTAYAGGGVGFSNVFASAVIDLTP